MADVTDNKSNTIGVSGGNKLVALVHWFNRSCAAIPRSVTLLVMRIAVALPFYFSGLLKWEGFFKLKDTAVFLFEHEFKLHIFGFCNHRVDSVKLPRPFDVVQKGS